MEHIKRITRKVLYQIMFCIRKVTVMKSFTVCFFVAAVITSALGDVEEPLAYPVSPNNVTNLEGRIVNGVSSRDGQWPWVVSIRAACSATQSAVFLCGGSILSNQWILTAGHCCAGFQRFEIGFGSVALYTPPTSMTSLNKVVHSNYNPNNFNNDVCLIKLPNPVTFRQNIRSIRLPSVRQVLNTFVGTVGSVAGWGITNNGNPVQPFLRDVNIRVISNQDCQRLYGSNIIIPSNLCTLGASFNAQGICNGDSGGPFMINEGGIWTQIGISSFVSSRGCAFGDPNGYARTSYYLEWIRSITGIPIRQF